MRIRHLPLVVGFISVVPAWAAPTGAPPAQDVSPLSLGKFRPGMTKEEGRAAGQVNCRPERRNLKGEPAEVRCDVPADQAKLGNLKVIEATLSYEQPRFDRIASVTLRAAGRAGPNSSEVAKVLGVKLMPAKRSYVASAGGVRVTVSDDLEEPETWVTWKAEATPDPKEAAKKDARAKADQTLLKGF